MRVFVGWDVAEMKAHLVACASLHAHAQTRHDVRRLAREELVAKKWYVRTTSRAANGQLWDDISDAPMSTGHAIGRFFVPWLCDYEGFALFTDGDVLFRCDVQEILNFARPEHAVSVVKHPPMPEQGTKKDGHIQTQYARKNWSSVMLFNCSHPANARLSLDILNSWPGRDLHAFKWLSDSQIGELPLRYNWLVNVSAPVSDPAIVHYTLGVPDLEGHADDPYANEWREAAKLARFAEAR